MQTLTDRDLSRLMTLQYVHGGRVESGDIVAFSGMRYLEDAGLVSVSTEEYFLFGMSIGPDVATITDKGKRVAEAGMMAMRETLDDLKK